MIANLYRTLILLGRLTLEQVPDRWRTEVEALIKPNKNVSESEEEETWQDI